MERTTKKDKGQGRVQGLFIRTTSKGERVYWFRYRIEGELRSWTFAATGLSEARRRAEEARIMVKNGVDPRPRPSVRTATLGRAAVHWLRSREAKTWRPRTREVMRGLIALHVLPGFRLRDPNSITRAQVGKVLDDLAERHPVTANRAHAAWRMLYKWLGQRRQEHLQVTVDPTRGLERPADEKPRDRTFSDDELRKILAASAEKADVRDYVEFLLHTGTRDGETRAMRWADIDFDRAVWTIPGDVAKNARPHVVPLSKGALAVLKRRDPSRFVSDRVFPFARQSKDLNAVGVAAGLGGALRLHDLRRTVGDRLRQEYGEAAMHAALGHADAKLTATYGPSPRLHALAESLQWWSDQLARTRKRKAATST